MAAINPREKSSIFAKLVKWALHLIGMFAIGAVIISALFAWRLASGPISLGFLTPYFEIALSSKSGAYRTVLKDTVLVWLSNRRAIDIQLVGTQVLSREGNALADIPVLSISLSAPALMFGRLVLKSLSIDGLRISLVRKADGDFSLDLSNSEQQDKALLANLLNEILQTPVEGGSVNTLRRVIITNASVTLDDQKSGVFWNAPLADLTFNRSLTGLTGMADLNLKIGTTNAKLSLQGVVDTIDKVVSVKVQFSDVIPSSIAGITKELSVFRNVNTPVNGSLVTNISYNGAIEPVDFEIEFGEGLIQINNPIEVNFILKNGKLAGSFDKVQSLLVIEKCELNLGTKGEIYLPKIIGKKTPLKSLSFAAKYLIKSQKLEFEGMSADLAGPSLNVRGVFQEIAEQTSFEINAKLKKLKTSEIAQYWPDYLESKTRAWVTKNLSVGSIPVARAKLSGRWSRPMGMHVDSLIGDLEFKNVTVDYFSPMPKATAANGRAKFDKKTLEIEIDNAQKDELKLRSGRVLFTGLEELDQFANVNLTIDGPLDSALKLIDDKPLEFTKSIGINTGSIEGSISTDIELKFIVEEALTAEQVYVSAKADLNKVTIPQIAFEKSLTDGDLSLSANNHTLVVEGEGKLENVPVRLNWRENFSDDAEFRTKYEISGQLNSTLLGENLDLDLTLFDERILAGIVKFDLTAKIDFDNKGDLTSVIDFKEAQIFLPGIRWKKSKTVETKMMISAVFSEQGIEKIRSLKVVGGGLTLNATADLKDNKIYKFKLKNLSIEDTKISGNILYNFGDAAEFQTKYEISGQLNSNLFRESLDLDSTLFDERFLTGILRFNLTAVVDSLGNGDVTAVIDLRETQISLPSIGWQKSKMVKTKMMISANISEQGIERIRSVNVVGGGLALSGTAELKDNRFYNFNIKNLSFGETIVYGNILFNGVTWEIELQGPKLDLTEFLDEEEQNNWRYVRGPPFKIDLNIDQIKLSPNRYLRNVEASLGNDGLVWSNVKLASDVEYKKAKIKESRNVDLKKTLKIYLVSKDGKRHLSVTAYDAGAVLKTFDLYKDIIGGKLMLEASFEDMSVDSAVAGTVKIHDFRVVNTPILARLLGLASIRGIPDELTGAGLSFQRLNAPFILKKGIINLKDAKAGGLSLGITVSGIVDKDSETLNIKGSVAPLEKINSLLGKVLGRVPLFGDLFTGGEKGGGLFAAEYSMFGPIDDPEIRTNPLTALTPGIFRNIFKILPSINKEEEKSDWLDPDDLN